MSVTRIKLKDNDAGGVYTVIQCECPSSESSRTTGQSDIVEEDIQTVVLVGKLRRRKSAEYRG